MLSIERRIFMALSTICPRRGDSYSWLTVDPVLQSGELAIEYPSTGVGTGLCKFKIGDGSTQYSGLPYAFDGESANSIDGGTSDSSHLIRIRSDSSYNWDINDPILALGEIGYDIDVNSFKVGDGRSLWSSLNYVNSVSDVEGIIDCGFEG
jgi:hypothetical protein